MNKAGIFKSVTAFMLVLLLALPCAVMSQDGGYVAADENTGQVFRPEQLDQMLAPVALYPDALLAQVFTAATYPLDIVSADRFIREHPGLRGQALVEAAKDKDWAPSVKAMLQFPDVVAMMDNQLEWTTKLGDAFLAQQREVMDSVQRLRHKAYGQGKLASSKEQIVSVDPQTQIIIIEQANPDIVYVPVYDPMVVYGPWWYPGYPPDYCFYPGFVTGFFLPGFFVSFECGWRSWDCDWHRHNVNIHINNFNNFITHSFVRPQRFHVNNAGRASVSWRHNAQFRRGAGYRDYWTAQRFGGRQSVSIAGAGNLKTVRPPAAPVQRAEFRARPVNPPAVRPVMPARVLIPQVSREREGATIFSNIGRGGSERAASFRGQSSFQSIRSSAGGLRGGGGMSHGGEGVGRSGGEGRGGHR